MLRYGGFQGGNERVHGEAEGEFHRGVGVAQMGHWEPCLMSARFRQFLTGFLLPAIALLFAVILVLIIIGKPQVGKKELLCAVI